MERTLKYLRGRGYVAEVVERRVPHSFRTRDFCGFADILAFRAKSDRCTVGHTACSPCVCGFTGHMLAVQATTAPDSAKASGGHMADRATKILAEPRAKTWLECGHKILVIGWALKGGAGSRKLWTPTILEITMNDYTQTKGWT